MTTKISDLISVSSLDGSELIEVVQSGANKKSPISKINEWTLVTDTTNLKIYERMGEVAIMINGLTVSTADYANVTTSPIKPLFAVWEKCNVGFLYVDATNGTVSLYNDALTGYTTGTVYGTLVFPTAI